MKHLIMMMLLIGSTITLAQNNGQPTLEERIQNRVNRLSRAIDRHLYNMTQTEKRELAQGLRDLIQLVRGNGGPGPGPNPNVLSKCGWIDGTRIGQRGWHVIESFNGTEISRTYFGNNGIHSAYKCRSALANLQLSSFEINQAKDTSCSCRWFSAENNSNGPDKRGWHLNYRLNLYNYNTPASYDFSTKFFGNNGSNSENNCKRYLRDNGFTCR